VAHVVNLVVVVVARRVSLVVCVVNVRHWLSAVTVGCQTAVLMAASTKSVPHDRSV